MRNEKPVYFDEQHRVWNVYRYEDVQRVLSDYTAFSSNFGGASAMPLDSSLISTDPPRHRQLRSLVTQAFTPRTIELLEPRIRAITDQLLDEVAGTGAMDVVQQLAYPLPVIVIAELLGIPIEERDQFKKWSDAIVHGVGEGQVNPQREMGDYFMRLIEERRRTPKQDLVSALLKAEIDGEKLTIVELLGFCVLLLVAGNETTTNLITNAILCFDEHPDALAHIQSDPSLLPGAIEEVLRYRSPVQSMFRSAIADTKLGDQTIQAGQRVVAWIGSANRDETQFPHAEQFDIRRTPNRHIAFGHGVHFCLGAPLARLEAKVVLRAMIERLPGLHCEAKQTLDPLPSSIVYGVRRLLVHFDAYK